MKKQPQDLLFHASASSGKANPSLLRVILGSQTTRLDFGYAAHSYYIKGGWITISPDTFLQIKGDIQRYQLKEAIGISQAPVKLKFKSTKDYQFFSLHFEPLPQKDLVFDMIENLHCDHTDFNYFGIEIVLKEGLEVLG